MREIQSVMFLVGFTALLLISVFPILEPVDAAVVSDYDIQVDTALVVVRYSEGYAGSVRLTLVNQCFHQLTVTVTTDGGEKVITQPSDTEIVLVNGKGTTKELSIAAVLLSNSSAGVYDFSIHTQITRVDGVPIENGKERHANIVVQALRHHDALIETGYLEAGKGAAISTTITVNNTGNFLDIFSLESESIGELKIIPAVDFMFVENGAVIEYPVIVLANEDTAPGLYSLEVTLTSLCDENFELTHVVLVDVAKERKDNEVGADGSFGSTSLMIIGGSLALVLTFLYFSFRILSSPGSPPAVTTGRDSRFIRAFSRHPHTPLVSRLGVVLVLLLSSLIVIGPISHASAQILPEVEMSMGPLSVLDPSPLTPDERAVCTFNISIRDDDPVEHVYRVYISLAGYHVGYVWEHRVSGGQNTTFPVTVAIPKGGGYRVTVSTIHISLIEHQGMPAPGMSEMDTGFLFQSEPYSIPQITSTNQIMILKGGSNGTLNVDLANFGNAYDRFQLHIEDEEKLESEGFGFSELEEGEDVDPREVDTQELNITMPLNPERKFTLIRIVANGEDFYKGAEAGTTVVLVYQEKGGEKGGEVWYHQTGFIAMTSVLLCVILAIGMFKGKRDQKFKRKGGREGNTEGSLESWDQQ